MKRLRRQWGTLSFEAKLGIVVMPVVLALLTGLVVDAALIIELGLDEGMDVLVVVLAGREVRQKRLRAQRGMRPEDIDSRMTAQASDTALEARADIVVRNEGTLEALSREADRVWTELSKRTRR